MPSAKPLGTVAGHHAGASGLRAFLDEVQAEPSHVEDYEIEIELPTLGRRLLLLNARKLREGPHGKPKILLAIDDITERRRVAEALGAAKREAEQANLGKSRFLAAASHDLRQPLQTLSFLQGILAKKVTDETRASAGRQARRDGQARCRGCWTRFSTSTSSRPGSSAARSRIFPINAVAR